MGIRENSLNITWMNKAGNVKDFKYISEILWKCQNMKSISVRPNILQKKYLGFNSLMYKFKR